MKRLLCDSNHSGPNAGFGKPDLASSLGKAEIEPTRRDVCFQTKHLQSAQAEILQVDFKLAEAAALGIPRLGEEWQAIRGEARSRYGGGLHSSAEGLDGIELSPNFDLLVRARESA